ncbi:M23 family metallopeptidase [Peredibacter sp. HCB2-198]|uniref:M23 family metallopeptidase n=1 Tax=Peredibacter sp. HCB2-198 TaxID=3383025 RepID=UPI0038B5A966
MRFFLVLLLCLSTAWAHEKELKTKADLLATGVFAEQKHHAWPFPLLSIGHNMQSYQYYGGSPYWHDGLDIRSEVDQPIHAAVGGKVVNIENYQRGNPLYWEIAILDDEGFVWKYHHVDQGSIPQSIKDAYRNKGRIATGAFIGNVVRWNITSFGEKYHHLHLLVVAKDGQYINPFLMMEPLADTKAPVINRIGLAKNHRPIDGTEISGPHALFMEASDLTLHDKFILPPYKISYSLDKADAVTVWEFINLPSGKNDSDYITDFYMDGTCGNYTCRKFYFNLNFTKANPRGTMKLTPGKHEVEVIVEDIVGNKTVKSFQWNVL